MAALSEEVLATTLRQTTMTTLKLLREKAKARCNPEKNVEKKERQKGQQPPRVHQQLVGRDDAQRLLCLRALR